MNFGERLTKLRKEKGLSQEGLANELNVSRQAVSKWESNNAYPETEKIIAICKLFNTSMDELIGLKNSKESKDKLFTKIFNILNNFIDSFLKGVKLFFNMTFKQKIICIFEMSLYSILLIFIFSIISIILVNIVESLLNILPNQILFSLIRMFEGILLLICLIIGIYSLIKLYKMRYLDYYDIYQENKLEEVNLKEEKIIIRNSKAELNFITFINKILRIFLKTLAILCFISILIIFIFILALIIFLLYFRSYGLIIIYSLIVLGGSLFILYIILELSIKYIFNLKQKPKHLYIMFILAMFLIGIGCGLFAIEFTKYKMVDESDTVNEIYNSTIEMTDNLVIQDNMYTKFIIEDRSDIEIIYYSNISNIQIKDYSYDDETYINNDRYKDYLVYDFEIYSSNTIFEDLMAFLENIRNYEFVYNSNADIYREVYISEENYRILQNNQQNYYNYDYYNSYIYYYE